MRYLTLLTLAIVALFSLACGGDKGPCTLKEGMVQANSKNAPAMRAGPATYRDDAEFDSVAKANCWGVPG